MLSAARSEELGILWPFYLNTFVNGLACAIVPPVIIIYFQDIGYSYRDISLLFSLQLLARLLFEIPTGAVADTYGRKASVLLGHASVALLTLMVPFFSSFPIIALIFFLTAVAETLKSGADEAWVVDLLRQNGKTHLVQSYYSRLMILVGAGIFIGGLVSSGIVHLVGLTTVWFVAAAGYIVCAMFLSLFAPEHFVRRRIDIKQALRESFVHSRRGFKYVITHSVLVYFLIEAMLWSVTALFFLAWQPYLKELGLSPDNFGIVFSVIGVMAIVGPLLSGLLMKVFRVEKAAIISVNIVYGIAFIFLACTKSLTLSLLTFALIPILETATGPIVRRFKQQFIPSEERATITSLFYAIRTPGAILSYLVGGTLLDILGIRTAFWILAAVGFLSTLPYTKMRVEGQTRYL